MLSFYTFIKYLQQNFLAIHRANKTISKAYWAALVIGIEPFWPCRRRFQSEILGFNFHSYSAIKTII